MDFLALQESLRQVVDDKIRHHEFTGASLANETGFQQAHVSNFLNRRRGLSLQAMDRILKALHLTVADLFDPAESEAKACVSSLLEDYENIPLVNPTATPFRHVVASKYSIRLKMLARQNSRRARR